MCNIIICTVHKCAKCIQTEMHVTKQYMCMRADECNNSFLHLAMARDRETPPLCDDTRGFATSPKLVTTTPVRCFLRPLRALCFCFHVDMWKGKQNTSFSSQF